MTAELLLEGRSSEREVGVKIWSLALAGSELRCAVTGKTGALDLVLVDNQLYDGKHKMSAESLVAEYPNANSRLRVQQVPSHVSCPC